MRLPRDVSVADLVKVLEPLGYRVTRQMGSHIPLTADAPKQHHITIPNHDPIRLGTLSNIVADVAAHLGLPRDEALERLFGKKVTAQLLQIVVNVI